MSDIEPKKLKVAELREELKARGLDTKGNKAQLVKRLEKAIVAEAAEADAAQESLDTTGEIETSQDESYVSEEPESHASIAPPAMDSDEPESIQVIQDPVPDPEPQVEPEAEVAQPAEEPEPQPEPEAEPEQKEMPQAEPEPEPEPVQSESTPEAEPEPVPEEKPEAEAEQVVVEKIETSETEKGETAAEQEPEIKPDVKDEVENKPDVVEPEIKPDVKDEAENKPEVVEPEIKPEVKEESDPSNESKTQSDEAADIKKESEPEAQIKNDVDEQTESESKTVMESQEEPEGQGKDVAEAAEPVTESGETPMEEQTSAEKTSEEETAGDSEQPEADQKMQEEKKGHKRKHSPSRNREGREGSDRDRHHRSRRSRSRSRSPRRRRSRSRSHERHHRHNRSRSPANRAPEVQENEDWINAKNVILDKYNSDLNLRISDEGYRATPITVEGFGFMWAGARANFGVKSGKVCYEVKIVEHLNVDHLPHEETSRHVVRVGWSMESASMQLGEEKLSYGYGGTAKKSVDCKFNDYGVTFGEGDVITAKLDFEAQPHILSFLKNGEDQGTCFEVESSELADGPLYPHVLSKNCEVLINFGQQEEPWFPVPEGFTLIDKVSEEERVRGALPPAKKEDCQIIMMCGLPGAGKTVWAAKHAKENPVTKFNVLGTNNIIDKMKVMGLPRKRNYAGRWDLLIDKSTKCLNRLLEIAAKKKRNYILDQTNVYPSAQRRKMRPFEGFQRKAVVIVPTDEEFKKRCAQREKEEGKEVPDSAVLEMKANFQLPIVGPLFDDVEFIELGREEAEKIVLDYNKEGQAALPPPEKRYREHGGYDYRGGRDRGGRDYRHYDDRRGGYYDRRRGGYMGYSSADRQRAERYDNRRDYRYREDQGHRQRHGHARASSDRGSKSPRIPTVITSKDNRNRNWGNQGGWRNQGWGNQGWGNQGWNNQGGWGNNSGWGNQGWGNQGSWGNNQWSGYNQGQGSNSNWNNYYSNWYGNPSGAQGGQNHQNWNSYYGNYSNSGNNSSGSHHK